MENDFMSGFLAGQGDGSNRNSGMFGGDGWWAIIIFALIFGWGRGGYGNGGTSSGAADNYVLASDFATLQRQIDSAAQSLERKGDTINSGLCDGFYAQNTTMLTGFGNVNQNMASGFASAELSRANQQTALMQQLNAANVTALQNANALQAQIAECCCDNKAAIAQNRYDTATEACATRQAIADASRASVDATNAGTRAVLDFLVQDKLSTLQSENQSLRLAASQAAQNNYLVSQLRPSPIPAYTVSNPYCCSTYTNCGL